MHFDFDHAGAPANGVFGIAADYGKYYSRLATFASETIESAVLIASAKPGISHKNAPDGTRLARSSSPRMVPMVARWSRR